MWGNLAHISPRGQVEEVSQGMNSSGMQTQAALISLQSERPAWDMHFREVRQSSLEVQGL